MSGTELYNPSVGVNRLFVEIFKLNLSKGFCNSFIFHQWKRLQESSRFAPNVYVPNITSAGLLASVS